MKKTMKLASAILAAAMLLTLTACGDKKASSDGKTYKIGICNYVDDASLNQINENIQARLDEIGKEKGVTFDISYDNPNADATVMNQIISNFQADKVDLMVGIATPVAMAMQAAVEGNDTPVVFSAVSDPVSAGLVASLEAPGANITGTSDYLDTNSIMDLIFAVAPDDRLPLRCGPGLLYHPHRPCQGVSGRQGH